MKDIKQGMNLVIAVIVITLIVSAATSAGAEEASGYDAATFKVYARQVTVIDDHIRIGANVHRNRQHDNERQAALVANDQRQYKNNAAAGQAHTAASQADWTNDVFVVDISNGVFTDETNK